MNRHLHRTTVIMKNQGNRTPSKEHSKLPVTDKKAMEIHELPDREFKIIVLKTLREMKEIDDFHSSIPCVCLL